MVGELPSGACVAASIWVRKADFVGKSPKLHIDFPSLRLAFPTVLPYTHGTPHT